MSASLGGVVARLGVVLVLTTIMEAGAKSVTKNKRNMDVDRMVSFRTQKNSR
jgi:hypothetical protein